MPRKTIKRIMPDHEKIRDHKHLRYLGSRLHDPNLWHLNRRGASGAFAVGLFFAWMPIPMQMLFAAIFAVIFRVNLPLSVVLVWISNPLTMPPMFYGAYLLGVKILGSETHEFSFEISLDWFLSSIGTIAPPLLTGCVVIGLASSAIGYAFIRLLWRLSVIREYKQRQNR
ncbi:MAG: DUF2062 domain-containing protein [Psychrobium sp.]